MQGEHEAYYHALYRVACLVNSSLELNVTLEAVVGSVVEAMRAKAGALRLLDRHGEALELVASVGLSERYLHKGPIMLAASAMDQEALSGRVVAVGDVSTDTRLQYPEELLREGITSVLSAPLIRHDHPIGVIRVYTGERHTFEQDEVEFLQALADICALSIENARMYDRLRRTYLDSVDALWGSASR